MTKTQAIKQNCYECAGDSHKDVTLCVLFDCPLWTFRLGSVAGTPVYKRKMEAGLKHYAQDVREMREDGLEVGRFLVSTHMVRKKASKRPFPRVLGRGAGQEGDAR